MSKYIITRMEVVKAAYEVEANSYAEALALHESGASKSIPGDEFCYGVEDQEFDPKDATDITPEELAEFIEEHGSVATGITHIERV